RRLLEEHRALMTEARGEAEQILAEARKTRESMEQRMREETESERQRRLEETRREIAAETSRALEQIRAEVADLTLEATSIVVGNPQLEPSAKAGILSDLAGDDEELFTNFLRLVAEKGRAGELLEIAAEFERLMAREERRLTVELTTARALNDDEAQAIVSQIEQAAGRKVEATRAVDPEIIGGI